MIFPEYQPECFTFTKEVVVCFDKACNYEFYVVVPFPFSEEIQKKNRILYLRVTCKTGNSVFPPVDFLCGLEVVEMENASFLGDVFM